MSYEAYDILQWISTLGMMGSSLYRSWNLGYQTESYLISTISQVPLTYDSIHKKDKKLILLNSFYLINCLIAAYRWSK